MNKKLIKDILDIKKFIENFNNDKIKLIDKNGGSYNNKTNFFYKLMLSNVFKDSPYRSFFINTLHKCESLFPNSSLYTLEKIINHVNDLNHKNNVKNKKAKKEDLNKILNQFIDKKTIDLFNDLLDFSGSDSSVMINSTDNLKSIIKKENISEFNIRCHDDLSHVLFSNNSKSKRDVLFLAYDGFLERDTDLYHLFVEAQQMNKLIVLMCRGINSYFIASVKKMIYQFKCPLVIYECPFNNSDPFLFDDICKSLQVNPVKIEDPSVIINQVKEKFRLVQNITLELDKISYEVPEDIKRDVVNELNESLKNSKDEYKDYILQRKKRFLNKKVNILISKDKKRLIEDLKFCFFVYNSICKYGITETQNEIFPKQLFDISERFSSKFIDQVKNISYIQKI